MPRKVPIPEPLRTLPFAVSRAADHSLGPERLRSADLVRPFHGVRSADAAPPTLLDQCRAYGERMRDAEFFSHLTAAELWGVPLPAEWAPGSALHVATIGTLRSAKSRGVVGHQIFDERLRVVRRGGFAVADAASTWCHLASLLSDEDLVAAGDHLVLTPAKQIRADPRPYTALAELAERAATYRGPGCRRARRAISLVRDGAESRRETLLRLRILAAGLPEPELGVDLTDASGTWIARVDMFYRRWRVVVEYDGDQHRTDTRQYERDIERIDAVRDAGNRVVRIRKSALAGSGARAVTLVRNALRAAGAPV